MNKILALALLVIMALLLLFCIKKLFPSAVKIFYIFIIAIICCFMVYLLWYLIDGVPFGSTGSLTQESEEQSSIDIVLSAEKLENCIELREDEIYINNELIEDMSVVESYISQRANDNVTIVIVDNYSFASLHHEITDLCHEKGANWKTISYEEWIEEQ